MAADGRAGSSLQDGSLRAFLDDLASDEPTPGGGGAAALAGATAAALVAMVARVTRARETSAVASVSATVETADDLRRRLTDLVAADAAAFQAVLAARRSTAPGGQARLARAWRGATEVPLEVARRSVDVLVLGAALAPWARVSTFADLQTAAVLAGAAYRAAAVTARANLPMLGDPASSARASRELATLARAGTAAGRRLEGALARRRRTGARAARRRGGSSPPS